MLRIGTIIAALLTTTTPIARVNAHEMYVSMIPNGANVPGVKALGHVNPDGGGTVNGFGDDFASAFYVWTKKLCNKDSDGDGQTNGQELGDPCCEWDLLSLSARWTEGVSHPGNASDTADESLWANITCPNSSSSSSSATDTAADSASSVSNSSSAGSTSRARSAASTVSVIAGVMTATLGLALLM
ncbi:atp-binding cassette superfamily [Phytophthora cinnamomi]|uniref:atp-binding cassette superfamily n=1 Tax=Phytophthora cinnamomi TaxID=4785 RepID=UPI00355AC6EE|nr:atp-binding cassette superfamily [Phytophthora cinnamomi]